MMNKKWKILISFIIFWFIISFYFYQQHKITVMTMNIPGWELTAEDGGVKIKQIRFYNKGPKKLQYSKDYSLPLRYRIINYLPGRELKMFAVKTIFFYSSPYENFAEGWRYEISGVYLKSVGKEKIEQIPDFKIFADDKELSYHSVTTLMGTDANLIFFTLGGEYVDIPVNQMKVQWNYRSDNSITKKYSYDFSERTYSFFNRAPAYLSDILPDKMARDFVFYYKSGKIADDQIINRDLLNELNWIKEHEDIIIHGPEISYLPKYMGYNDIYKVTMEFSFDRQNYEKVNAVQKLYLVNREGKWVIIAIDPVVNN